MFYWFAPVLKPGQTSKAKQLMSTHLFDLSQKVILVTGGTGVLGEAFCRAIGDAGGTVVIIGRNETIGNERVAGLKEHGMAALFARADVLIQADLDRVCEQVLDTYGRIDGLVNGAGGNVTGAVVQPDQAIFSVDVAALRAVFELNLYGTILPTLTFGKQIVKQGGSIINISSMAAQSAITRVLGYSLAKASVDSFTRWMAVELANRYGDAVRINGIAPGFFVTEQNRHLLTNPDGSPTTRGEAVLRNTPYKRFGQPDELAGALIWLLSEGSRFVNGETICVDGGFNVFSGV